MEEESTTDRAPPGGLAMFRDLGAGAFYEMAPRTVLERGLKYFLEKRVLAIAWNAQQSRIAARVRGSDDYVVGLTVDRGLFESECDCPAWRQDGVCKHAVAVAAAVSHILQGRSFGMQPPEAEYIQRLRRSLVGDGGNGTNAGTRSRPQPVRAGKPTVPAPAAKPPTEPPPATGAKLTLEQHSYLGFVLLMRGHMPAPLRRAVEPYQTWGLGGRELSLGHGDFASSLATICRLARRHDVPVYFTHKGREIPIQPVAVHCEDRVTLDLMADGRVRGFVLHADPEGGVRLPALELGPQAFLDGGGVLVFRDAMPARPVLEVFVARSLRTDFGYHFEPWRRPPQPEGPLATDEFNARAMELASEDWAELLPGLQLLHRGQPADAPHPSRPEAARIELHLDPGPSGTMIARTVAVAAGAVIPLRCLGESLRRFLEAYEIDGRLMSAQGRVQLLAGAVLRLHEIESRGQRDAFIEEIARNEVFARLRLRAHVKRFLRRYAKDWLGPTARQTVRLAAVPEVEKPWRFIRLPVAEFAQFCIRLANPERREDLATVGRDKALSRLEVPGFLQKTLAACAAQNIPLRYAGRPIERAAVEIDVEIGQGGPDSIDWFELKTEVRCASITIPQREWEKLIRGELILRHEGRIVIPEAPATGALAALHRLVRGPAKAAAVERRAGAGATHSIPRLQILEWLELRKAGARVKAPPEIEAVFDSLAHFKSIPDAPLPSCLDARLRDYQKRGFDWLHFLHRHRFGACLADDMGLGKTLQAIALLAILKETDAGSPPAERAPHLVVVPPSLVFNWRQEIARFCPALRVAEFHGTGRNLDDARAADVVLTTYDIVRIDIAKLEQAPFGVVVLDETQTLKNLSAARTQAAARLRRRFTLCLTGTPLENHVGEYYSIIELALPGIFGDYRSFRARAAKGDTELIGRARPFVLRRTKGEILRELPPKTEQDVFLDMTHEQKEYYTRAVGEVRQEVLEAYRLKTRSQAGIAALAALMRLRQICISPEILGRTLHETAPKIGHLLEKLAELDAEGHAALVFSQFTRALDLIEAAAKRRGLPFLRMDGSTPTARRRELVNRFQSPDGERFFLVSLKTGGVGLNLTRANYVFHVDPWWNPAVETQAADRAHRIGQRQAVLVQRLLMRHSIEEKMMLLKARKQALFDQIVGAAQGARDPNTLISREDFEFLLT